MVMLNPVTMPFMYDAACMQLDAKGQAFEQPLELSFQDQYGDIERHLWFGDGYILLGFNTGQSYGHSMHQSCILGAHVRNREGNSKAIRFKACVFVLPKHACSAPPRSAEASKAGKKAVLHHVLDRVGQAVLQQQCLSLLSDMHL